RSLVVLLRARIISLASGTPRNRGQLTAAFPRRSGSRCLQTDGPRQAPWASRSPLPLPVTGAAPLATRREAYRPWTVLFPDGSTLTNPSLAQVKQKIGARASRTAVGWSSLSGRPPRCVGRALQKAVRVGRGLPYQRSIRRAAMEMP